MRQLRKFIKATNRVGLSEKSVPEIKASQRSIPGYADPGTTDSDEILEVFELVYEIEYKYHAIKNNSFSGMQKRKDNILKILSEVGEEAVAFIAETFEKVFSQWLENHALTDPEAWARARFYDDGGDSLAEINGFSYAMDLLTDECSRYGLNRIEDLILEVIQIDPSIISNSFLNDWVSDEYDRYVDELEYEGVEEINNRFNKEFESEEEAREFLDKYVSAYDKDYFEIMGSEKEALAHIVEELVEMEFFENSPNVENFIDVDEFFLTAYEKILFPAWFKYWASMGIVETRKNVESVHEDLLNIEKLSLEKQFLTLNIAKNTNHQNGSMMEYYEEMWGVDYIALEKLSDMSVDEWDDDLRSIGVSV